MYGEVECQNLVSSVQNNPWTTHLAIAMPGSKNYEKLGKSLHGLGVKYVALWRGSKEGIIVLVKSKNKTTLLFGTQTNANPSAESFQLNICMSNPNQSIWKSKCAKASRLKYKWLHQDKSFHNLCLKMLFQLQAHAQLSLLYYQWIYVQNFGISMRNPGSIWLHCDIGDCKLSL